jgi:signal peptidase
MQTSIQASRVSIARGRPLAFVGRWTHRMLNLACAVLVLTLVAVAAAKPLGFQVRVDRSDSMLPAIAAGDVVVSRVVAPSEVRRGDIVSFNSPERRDVVLTHRVVSRRTEGPNYAFVTKGDANTGVERWKVDRQGRVGRMELRVPRVGYAFAWAGGRHARLILVLGCGVVLCALVARSIWRM